MDHGRRQSRKIISRVQVAGRLLAEQAGPDRRVFGFNKELFAILSGSPEFRHNFWATVVYAVTFQHGFAPAYDRTRRIPVDFYVARFGTVGASWSGQPYVMRRDGQPGLGSCRKGIHRH